MKKILKIITHPVTYTNLLIIGSLILIQFFHTRAHYKMRVDVHGYCHQYNMINPNAFDEEDDW